MTLPFDLQLRLNLNYLKCIEIRCAQLNVLLFLEFDLKCPFPPEYYHYVSLVVVRYGIREVAWQLI